MGPSRGTAPEGRPQGAPARTSKRSRPAWLGWPRWLNQVRLLALVLVVLGIFGAATMGTSGPGLVLAQLLAFPLAAGGLDAVLGRYRWGEWRLPWNGVITGLFVALLVPPQGSGLSFAATPLLLDGALLSAIAILGKHVIRWKGRPILNPAASVLLLGGAVLGIAPAWWGTLGPTVTLGGVAPFAFPVFVVGGLLVNARTWRRWTLPAAFFATYAIGVTVQRALAFSVLGIPLDAGILLSEMVDPATLFFLLFMVVEPRTAPADPRSWPVYGGLVGVAAAMLSITIPDLGAQSTIGPFALLLALVIGNLFALLLRERGMPKAAPVSRAAVRTRVRGKARSTLPPPPARRARWGWPEGVLTVTLALLLLGYAYAVTPPPPSFNAGSLTASSLSCAHDNMSIPQGQRATLHNLLGPSIIFWYDNQTGRTVFYDPINNVTVYETDLYEDHGMAEWNGDDYILASGCHPMTGSQV